MKTRLRIWTGFLILCMLLAAAPISAIGAGQYSEFYAVAHSNLYRDPFRIHLYRSEGKLYIDSATLAGISGFEQTGERNFSLGGITMSPARSRKFGETWGFPMEGTLDRFGVRVFERDGELYFLSGRDALRVLFEADSSSRRYPPLIDPDDFVNTLGAALSYAKDFLLSGDFRPVLQSYRNAMYKLVQEDMDETTFSKLQKQWEDGVNKPVSTAFTFLESFMDEEEIEAFYSSGELMDLKSYLDGVKLNEKILGMSLSSYYRRLEEIGLFFDTNLYALEAMGYAAEAEPVNSSDKAIIKAAREITRSAEMKTTGWDERLFSQLAREHITSLFYSTSANLIKEILLCKNKTAPLVLKTVLNKIPAFSFMSDLAEAYTFAEIQQFFLSEMIGADVDDSWVKYKYMAIMYYRCFYASCGALQNADMKDLVPDWKDQMKKFREEAMAQIAALASVPDSALEPFMANNMTIDPARLRPCDGPEPDYSRLAPYQEETEIGELSAAVQGAKQAWAEMCGRYGQASLVKYNGETYIDEGNGAVLPLLCRTDGNYFLVVLIQQDETLEQILFSIDEDGAYRQVFSDRALTLGERATLFLYERSGNPLISMASLEDDLAVYAALTPQMAEKRFFQGDETAESIAEMGLPPLEAFEALYGNPEYSIRVDANFGLFRVQLGDVRNALSLFGVAVPR